MTAAAHLGGEVAPSELDVYRARTVVAEAAEVLAAVCRDHRASPDVIAAAERRLSQAFADFGGLMLAAASLRSPSR